ncbi:MAG: ubiquinol-cytochrome c reductase iron-sulfur subunit [Chloroflexota bacterium]|nr:ubiquinol-cytochrome c reductase iron-sulfur subunit [Chloroflexota bacterium]
MTIRDKMVPVNRTNGRRVQKRRRMTRWQTEFPYHWDADDFVSRRELLNFTVMASGALFAATTGIVALSYLRPTTQVRQQALIDVSQLAPGEVHYFQYPTADDQAILLHLPEGRFAAYSGKCTHLSCAVYYDKGSEKLLCPCHEGAFDPRTGGPISGPPQRPLPSIKIRQDGSMLYAVEETP